MCSSTVIKRQHWPSRHRYSISLNTWRQQLSFLPMCEMKSITAASSKITPKEPCWQENGIWVSPCSAGGLPNCDRLWPPEWGERTAILPHNASIPERVREEKTYHHIIVYAGDTSVYSRRIVLSSSRSTALEKSGTKRRWKTTETRCWPSCQDQLSTDVNIPSTSRQDSAMLSGPLWTAKWHERWEMACCLAMLKEGGTKAAKINIQHAIASSWQTLSSVWASFRGVLYSAMESL